MPTIRPTDLKRFEELTPPGRWLVSWAFAWRMLLLFVAGALLLQNSAQLGFLIHQHAPHSLADSLTNGLGWFTFFLCILEPIWLVFWVARATFGPYRLLCLEQGELKSMFKISPGKALRVCVEFAVRLSLVQAVFLLATVTAGEVIGAGKSGSSGLWFLALLAGLVLSVPSFYRAIARALGRQYGSFSLRFVAASA